MMQCNATIATDFKETDAEYHVKASPKAISRLCPHCGRDNDTVTHAKRTLAIRDIPSHGKAVAVHLDVPRFKCRPCNKTFTASVPEVDAGREMTERLVRWVGRQASSYTYADSWLEEQETGQARLPEID